MKLRELIIIERHLYTCMHELKSLKT